MTIAEAIRAGMPLGLNVESPFSSLSDSIRTPSLIPPPEDVVEDEVRRSSQKHVLVVVRHGTDGRLQ
jgi:hypothetical protein